MDPHNTPAPAMPKPSTMRLVGRALAGPLALGAYGAVIFEEYVWNKAKQGMDAIGKLPIVAKAEDKLRNASPLVAGLFFFIPGLSVIPFKLAAFALISGGHALAGAAVFIAAKAVGAALVGRVWSLTEKTLRTVAWIDKSVDKVMDVKDRVKTWSANLYSVRYAKVAFKKIKKIGQALAAKAFPKPESAPEPTAQTAPSMPSPAVHPARVNSKATAPSMGPGKAHLPGLSDKLSTRRFDESEHAQPQRQPKPR